MKKLIAMLLVLVMALSMTACGGSEKDAANAPAAEAAEYKVAMVTDYGDITDQSFNQTTWEAVLAFAEQTGTEVKYYKPTNNDRDVKHFLSFAKEQSITRGLTVAYKQYLQEQGYAICSINSMLASLNSLLSFLVSRNAG